MLMSGTYSFTYFTFFWPRPGRGTATWAR